MMNGTSNGRKIWDKNDWGNEIVVLCDIVYILVILMLFILVVTLNLNYTFKI